MSADRKVESSSNYVYCEWCEQYFDGSEEEFAIRRYLAVGGWMDVAYHPKCYIRSRLLYGLPSEYRDIVKEIRGND